MSKVKHVSRADGCGIDERSQSTPKTSAAYSADEDGSTTVWYRWIFSSFNERDRRYWFVSKLEYHIAQSFVQVISLDIPLKTVQKSIDLCDWFDHTRWTRLSEVKGMSCRMPTLFDILSSSHRSGRRSICRLWTTVDCRHRCDLRAEILVRNGWD